MMNDEIESMDISYEEISLPEETLIEKHKAVLKLGFFNPIFYMDEAFYDEEVGWRHLFLGYDFEKVISNNETLRSAFIELTENMARYHRRVCGTVSFSGTKLGCPGECMITFNDYSMSGMSHLDINEATVLMELYKRVSKLDNLDEVAYTPEAVRLINNIDVEELEECIDSPMPAC